MVLIPLVRNWEVVPTRLAMQHPPPQGNGGADLELLVPNKLLRNFKDSQA